MSIFNCDRLQLWGGVECTVNRVGDQYHDQLLQSGHAERDEDIDRFAELGISALRYPVLWERTLRSTSPEGRSCEPDSVTAPAACSPIRNESLLDWSWSDRRLGRIRELGVTPIVGLVHHGSGPAHTSLLDPGFVCGLEKYAAAVAERYPWVEAYTPVNEPLTTARFSGLYGHWYPHERSDQAFATALIHQCLATARAMRAIRRFNPRAKLILTEDLAKVHSTPRLAHQAAFENERRWLSIDLLMGRVTEDHPMRDYLARTPRLIECLEELSRQPCPPDIIGFNYYLTSERLLDERIERYPVWTHGGNGRQTYADVEAVRVRREGIDGPERLIREAGNRFNLPMAITEVHLGGHREEQVRWLLDSWMTAHDLRASGVDIRAIAAWSLLGSFDWNSLCTRSNGCYEPGVFDVRSGRPRPTAIARAIKQLATGCEVDTTAIPHVGWWRTERRLCYPPVSTNAAGRIKLPIVQLRPHETKRPLLIVGDGHLNHAFARVCTERAIEFTHCTLEQLAQSSLESLARSRETRLPWAAVCVEPIALREAELAGAHPVKKTSEGLRALASQCAALKIPLLGVSSHAVFVPTARRAYCESEPANAISAHGRRLQQLEQLVLAAGDRNLIVRAGAVISPWCEHNTFAEAMKLLADGASVLATEERTFSLTYVPDLIHTCLDLLVDQEVGVWHLANSGQLAWAELLRRAATMAGFSDESIVGCSEQEPGGLGVPENACALTSERGELLPPVDDALRRYCSAMVAWSESDKVDDYGTLEEATDVA